MKFPEKTSQINILNIWNSKNYLDKLENESINKKIQKIKIFEQSLEVNSDSFKCENKIIASAESKNNNIFLENSKLNIIPIFDKKSGSVLNNFHKKNLKISINKDNYKKIREELTSNNINLANSKNFSNFIINEKLSKNVIKKNDSQFYTSIANSTSFSPNRKSVFKK